MEQPAVREVSDYNKWTNKKTENKLLTNPNPCSPKITCKNNNVIYILATVKCIYQNSTSSPKSKAVRALERKTLFI